MPLQKRSVPPRIDRIGNSLRAALNLAADTDDRINRRAWEVGLQAIPDAVETRNVILSDGNHPPYRHRGLRHQRAFRIVDRGRRDDGFACEPTDAA